MGHTANSSQLKAAMMGKGKCVLKVMKAWRGLGGGGLNFCFNAFLVADGTPSFFSLCIAFRFFFPSLLFPLHLPFLSFLLNSDQSKAVVFFHLPY